MPVRRLIPALIALLAVPALCQDALAQGPRAVRGEVVVRFKPGSTAHTARVAGTRPALLRVRNVRAAVRGLRARRDVAYAAPNVIARIAQSPAPAVAGYVPNDSGNDTTGVPGGWAGVQWNFTGQYGVGAELAWQHAIDAGVPGGLGVKIAVLDTGVAYSSRPPYTRSEDFTGDQFVRGWDFVDHDPYPFDRNGHGTHVAGTLAEATNNGFALTGLAYGARLMPIRVLNDAGEGTATDIASGVRYAARHGAKVINMSLEFDKDVVSTDIPQLVEALSYARSLGALVVAASGNEARSHVAYPARIDSVMSVGATTQHGCVSAYSNGGRGLDIVAPGGGADRRGTGDSRCNQRRRAGANISQVTLFGREFSQFGIPDDYEGTSMAVPHVAATAALVIATAVVGRNPSPATVERRLESTTRDLGKSGYDELYGNGLVDAAAATDPATGVPPTGGSTPPATAVP